MRYLGLALFAEGPTDHRFLRPVLSRLTEDICLRECPEQVEMGAMLELHSPGPASDAPRGERIFMAAKGSQAAWHILFVHADGAGSPSVARAEQIIPAFERIAADLEGMREAIAVVPVRETEAWALCDPDAIRTVLGTTLSSEELSLPEHAGRVETIADPKALLQTIGAQVAGSRRGTRRSVGSPYFLQRLGEYARLDRLRGVPAFQQLEADLREALTRLHIIR